MKTENVVTTASAGGTGIGTVLFLIFLVFKLTGVITWSWWWVTVPLWGPIVLFLLILIIFFMVLLGMKITSLYKNRQIKDREL